MPVNKFTTEILAMAAAMLLAGCSSTTGDGPLPEEPEPLRMEFTAVPSDPSRALTNADNITDNPFAVWGSYVNTANGGTHQTVFDNTTVTYSEGAWGYTDAQYWLPGFTYSFAALHPASADGATVTFANGAITLDYTISTDPQKRVDLLHAVAVKECGDYLHDASLKPGPVDMQFAHILCQVHFIVKVDPAVNGDVTVTSARLWGIDRRAIFERATTAGNNYHWVNMTDRDEAMPTTKDQPYVERTEDLVIKKGEKEHLFQIGESRLLIIPQYVGSDATLEVTYRMPDGRVRTATADISQAAALHSGRWLIGRSFSYTLTVGADEYIIFEKPEISDWQMSEGGNYIIQDK